MLQLNSFNQKNIQSRIQRSYFFKIIMYFIMENALEKFRGRMYLMLTCREAILAVFPWAMVHFAKDQETFTG